MLSTKLLQDKVVLVTGASSGIGAATAALFAKAGANVVLAARRTDKLDSVREACIKANSAGQTGKGGHYASIPLDMCDTDQVNQVFSQLPDWGRNVDVLGTDRVGDIKADAIDRMLDTNVHGLIHLTQQFVCDFKERNAGHIINLGSIAGVNPYPGGSVYCASKAALHSFTTALRMELVDTAIRVSEIQPGMVETEFSLVRFRGDQSAADKVYEGIEPLSAEDIAEEVVWAASRKPHVNIADVLILPTSQASSYHVARK